MGDTERQTADFITGVSAAACGAAFARLLRAETPLTLLVGKNLGRVEVLAEDGVFFSREIFGGENVVPAKAEEAREAAAFLIRGLPEAPAEEDASGAAAFETACDRLAALTALREAGTPDAPPLILACTPAALEQPVPAPSALARAELTLSRGMKISLREVAEKLACDFDYDNEALCEAPGQFSVRGGLIDVYPLNASAPVRIDFFGDEIEALREFDPETQRSLRKLEKIVVAAGAASDASAEPPRAGALFDYFPAGTAIVFAEPETLDSCESLLARAAEKNWRVRGFSSLDEVPEALRGGNAAETAWRCEDLEEIARGEISSAVGAERLAEAEEIRRRVLVRLDAWSRRGERVVIVVESEGGEERLREILDEEKQAGTLGKAFSPEILRGNVSAGFRAAPASGEGRALVVATERELFGRSRRRISRVRSRRLPHKSRVEQLLDFNELADGDLLVHLQHGVCIYRGIKLFDRAAGTKEEMLALEFENRVTLYVPLREAHLLSRYVGLRKTLPKLGKVGGNSWEKTRRAAEKATLDFAAELLALQAKRQTKPGFAAQPDEALPWLREFERAFPFTETPDQAKAIAETKLDMERASPMDRLVCGDVGYGKTEVAIRAAFKAVLSGFQVAFLAPTTVLAQQHFNTFRDRFAQYPVAVEMLSRFRTPSQRAKILAQLASGEIDVVIGTHALLSSAVKFKKLGLLVIDEEHRFGVKQKEKIKRLRENVDVLAMSATPIPRTLYLALMGARDLSVIETAPRERLPIRTVVRTYDPKLVKEAILHEISRGGQVFYLHNRVDTIHEVAALLQRLVPEARIAVGHGQMEERELERVMTDFVAGTSDVLVCTTIIETGLDIPNCNTIIIEAADRFGLSQLYQLRGRVGRFNRQAYAYLLLHRHRALLETAKKRLSALRQFNQLGAGFRIAMRDLELRGAGNILGTRQSGHIAGVGFELYCRLLRQSIAVLKGEKNPAKIFRAEIRLDFVQFSRLPESGAKDARSEYRILKDEENAAAVGEIIVATLPAEYISDIRVRIDAFRRLATAGTPDEVRAVAESMEDRFGKLPPEARAFCAVAELRCVAEAHGIIELETEAGAIRARRRSGDYVRVGANFPRLSSLDPFRRLRELRDFLLRQ